MKNLIYAENKEVIGTYPDAWIPPAGSDIEEGVASGNMSFITIPDPVVSLAEQAKIQLNKVTGASGTIMRCVAAGVAVPVEWQRYVKSLRDIANGTDTESTVLPTQPDHPAGTD